MSSIAMGWCEHNSSSTCALPGMSFVHGNVTNLTFVFRA